MKKSETIEKISGFTLFILYLDTVASTYEKLQPGYVDELYQTIFDYIHIDESSNAIEEFATC